jgi:uncharacterized membrane protein
LSLGFFFVYLKKVAAGLKSLDKCLILILSSAAVYVCVLSLFTIGKHAGFGTFAWDLGLFNQVFHTTLFDGRFFYFTAELYLNPTGCYFASKFSPILFVVLPFYVLNPSPETLLIFKSIVLGFAALPLYLLSAEMMGDRRAGLAMGLTYLLYPAVQAANSFDFQPQAFIPLVFFSMSYFLLKGRLKLYFGFVFLSLMIEENVAIIVFFFSLMQLLTLSRVRLFLRALRNMRFPRLRGATGVPLATMFVSVVGYFVSRFVKGTFPLVPEFVEVYRTTDGFHVLGGTNEIVAAPLYAVLNPVRAVEALSYDFQVKVLYLMFLFAPLLFLSFKSKLSFAIVALLLPFLLSNYLPYYTLGAQYPLYVVPLVFLAAVEGLSKLEAWGQRRAKVRLGRLNRRLVSVCVLGFTLVFSVFLSPISPLSKALTSSPQILWYPQPYQSKNHIEILHEMILMIPSNASVLTQNNIFPHLSGRVNAYVLPLVKANSQPAETAMENYTRNMINMSDYILLDSLGYSGESSLSSVLDEVMKNGNFKTFWVGQSAILFVQRSNETSSFVPNPESEVFVGSSDFTLTDADVINDDSSKSGAVVYSRKGGNPGIVVYGPYVFLPSGSFEITFEIKFGSHDNGYLGKIDVAENFGSILVQKELYGSTTPTDLWANYTLVLSSATLKHDVEFRFFTSGLADLYLDRVIVKKIT